MSARVPSRVGDLVERGVERVGQVALLRFQSTVVLLPLPPRGGGLIRRNLDVSPQHRQGVQQSDLG
jgi:hypothetical protein